MRPSFSIRRRKNGLIKMINVVLDFVLVAMKTAQPPGALLEVLTRSVEVQRPQDKDLDRNKRRQANCDGIFDERQDSIRCTWYSRDLVL